MARKNDGPDPKALAAALRGGQSDLGMYAHPQTKAQQSQDGYLTELMAKIQSGALTPDEAGAQFQSIYGVSEEPKVVEPYLPSTRDEMRLLNWRK